MKMVVSYFKENMIILFTVNEGWTSLEGESGKSSKLVSNSINKMVLNLSKINFFLYHHFLS